MSKLKLYFQNINLRNANKRLGKEREALDIEFQVVCGSNEELHAENAELKYNLEVQNAEQIVVLEAENAELREIVQYSLGESDRLIELLNKHFAETQDNG